MFPPLHHPLIDNLGRIISPRIYMYTFLDYRVAACPQGLSSLVSTRLDLGLLWLLVLHVGSHCEGKMTEQER